jgi:hypothetical protein
MRSPSKRKIATNIPSDVLEEATSLTGLNQTAAIIAGLHELIRRQKINKLIGLKGKLHFSYDVAASRDRPKK